MIGELEASGQEECGADVRGHWGHGKRTSDSSVEDDSQFTLLFSQFTLLFTEVLDLLNSEGDPYAAAGSL